MKNLLLLAISLPLLLGGCGENVVNDDEIEYREGVAYLKGSNRSYTGKIIGLNSRGEKRSESQLEKGKMISWIGWHDNGKKAGEENYQNGQSYRKYWNEKGEIVSSLGEALGSVSYDEGSFNNEGIYYVKNSDIPYTGFAHSYNNKGQVILTVRLKEGKKTQEMKRHLNGKPCFIKKYKDGELISENFWNSKGEPVDTYEESIK